MPNKPLVDATTQYRESARRRRHPVALALLFGLWMILSGKLDLFHLAMGLGAVLFVAWQESALVPLEGLEEPPLRPWRVPPYLLWIFGQMVLSSLYVARLTLHPRRHLNPRLVEFQVSQPSLLGRVILANSITLTPGTLTVDLQGDRLTVHTLSPKTTQDVLAGGMARRVGRLFTDDPLPPLRVLRARRTDSDR